MIRGGEWLEDMSDEVRTWWTMNTAFEIGENPRYLAREGEFLMDLHAVGYIDHVSSVLAKNQIKSAALTGADLVCFKMTNASPSRYELHFKALSVLCQSPSLTLSAVVQCFLFKKYIRALCTYMSMACPLTSVCATASTMHARGLHDPHRSGVCCLARRLPRPFPAYDAESYRH